MADNHSLIDDAVEDLADYVQGIGPNLGQFAQQLLQVFFVGLTIGMQRNVVSVLAETEFGVPAGSFTLLMAFVVSFGFVKAAAMLLSGGWIALMMDETLARLSPLNDHPENQT